MSEIGIDDRPEDERANEYTKITDRHILQLMEHFDSVQIFCTKHDTQTDRTFITSRGSGNWYSRFGQVNEWVDTKREENRIDVQRRNQD